MMNTSQKRIWIFAYRYNGEYTPEEIVDNPEDQYAGLEYDDVKKGEYQLWEYPSGKIFNIDPDRQLTSGQNQYSTPYSSSGTVWLPKLVETGLDKEKVSKAYRHLALIDWE